MAANNERDLIAGARKQAAGAKGRSVETVRADVAAAAELLGAALPNYRLLGELHHGGQGVVYKALHLATMRTVAIKVLREGPLARPADRVRFEREVQLLAGLRHPNIVTIHDSGVASGFFYYVMDFIEGRPLHHAVADFETGTSSVAASSAATVSGKLIGAGSQSKIQTPKSKLTATLGLFAKVCEAVNAAHLRGVIHRDLKPGNVLVDASGEPHVLDFGLAKEASPGSSAEVGFAAMSVMTQTGQFVGSLPWASPEQAEGHADRIDVRTDVYSLGVVLYQMLTGEFPYRVFGPMREVLSEISTAEPKRPSERNNAIDVDVDTIVLKCLSKERDRRYQSAGELARDVRRYLAGEPIEARRDSALYVLRRSIQQHRAAIGVGAAFVLLACGAALVSYRLYLQQVDARERADAASVEARLQSERAERFATDARRRFEDARETIEFLTDQVSSELQHVFGAAQVRREILKGAYERLTALAAEKPDDPRMSVDMARLYLRMARLANDIQDREEMERQLANAFALLEPLLEADDSDGAATVALVDALRQRVDYRWRGGSLDSAEADIERAAALVEKLRAARPDELKFVQGESLIVERRAILAQLRGDESTDERLTNEMVQMKRKLVSGEPDNVDYLTDLGVALERQANRMMRRGKIDDAEQLVRESMSIREALVARNPESRVYVRALSLNHEQMANICSARRDYEAERPWNEKMYEGKKRMVALAPHDWQAQHDMAICLDRLGAQADRDGNAPRSAEYHDQSVAIYHRLVDGEPGMRRFKIDLMYGLRLRARVGEKLAESDLVGRCWREIVELAAALGTGKVDEADRLEILADAHLGLARMSDPAARAEHIAAGRAACEALAKLRPDSRGTKKRVADFDKLESGDASGM